MPRLTSVSGLTSWATRRAMISLASIRNTPRNEATGQDKYWVRSPRSREVSSLVQANCLLRRYLAKRAEQHHNPRRSLWDSASDIIANEKRSDSRPGRRAAKAPGGGP